MNFRRLPPVVAALLLCGCATLPKDIQAPPSYAVAQDTSTTLGRFFPPRQDKQSGFLLLDTGKQAFSARLAMAEVAEKTIDAQYFIWSGDAVGVIFMSRLIKAADRGVRVRLLLDDLTTHGRDIGLATIDKHANIEVRLYNPLGRRYYWRLFRTLSLAFHSGRMTHRMHNKMYIVDNQAAIVGGRNIADEYFGVDPHSNFRDMDLLTVGPVVTDVSKAFDDYWNSAWSVPLDEFKINIPSEKKWAKHRAKIEKDFVKKTEKFPYPLEIKKDEVVARLENLKSHVIWAESEIVCDPPDKPWVKAGRPAGGSTVVARLVDLGLKTQKEILIVSPYLIMSPEAIDDLGKVAARNVSVRILTNSMASTDALPVVAMYRGTRTRFLSNGIGLYEARPDAASRSYYDDPSVSTARFSLHGKITVYDRTHVFVGTFNIDPRSQYLNTEVGLLVHSPQLAEQVTGAIERDLEPANGWTLSLNDKNKVIWTGVTEGREVHFKSEPHAGYFKRFSAWFLSLLPIKSQL